MNENNVERIAKILAEDHGDPQAWGAYASKAMQIIEIAHDEWMPIETAPRDGKSFMLYVEKYDVGPHCFAPVSIDADGGWWEDSTADHIEPIKGASFWRPLPIPPLPTQEG